MSKLAVYEQNERFDSAFDHGKLEKMVKAPVEGGEEAGEGGRSVGKLKEMLCEISDRILAEKALRGDLEIDESKVRESIAILHQTLERLE